MPLVNIHVFEGRLTPETETQLIEGITDVIVGVFGEQVRDATWVILQETSAARWGIGGRPGASPIPR